MDYAIAPSPFHGVHGTDFDADGNLLVGDIAGFAVHKVDLGNGQVSTVSGPYDGLADDVKVAPDDDQIVWTTSVDGRVMSLMPDGVKAVLAIGLSGVNAIAFHPDGRLFASQHHGPGRIWEIDRTGREAPRLAMEGLVDLNGFSFDADGTVIGPVGLMGDAKIVAADFDAGTVDIIAKGFHWLGAAKVGPNGKIYASELLSGEIWEVDRATGDKRLVATLGYLVDNLGFRSDGTIIATVTRNNAIVAVDPETGATEILTEGVIATAGGIAIDVSGMGSEALYIAGFHAFGALDLASGRMEMLGQASPDALYFPNAIDVSGNRVAWSAWVNGVVRVSDRSSGETVRTIRGLALPQGILLRPDGSILVAEEATGRLLKIPSDSDEPMVIADGLDGPFGLVADGADHVIVSERAGGTVTRICLAGGGKRQVAAGLFEPEGIARLDEEEIVVVETGAGRLTRLDMQTGAVSVLASGFDIGLHAPEPFPRSWLFSGVAVDRQDGTIYVSSDIESAVYRLVPIEH